MGAVKKKSLPNACLSTGLLRFVSAFPLILVALCPCAAAQTNEELNYFSERIALGTEEVKLNALLSLRRYETEAASRVAAEGLKDLSVLVRATAIGAMIFLPDTEALPLLIPHLRDPSPFIRKETAYTLGEIGGANSSSDLIAVLLDDRKTEVRAAAAFALGKSGSARAVVPLTRVLSKKPKKSRAFLRRSAARSIGQIAESVAHRKLTRSTPENYLPDKYKTLNDMKSADGTFAGAVEVLEKILANPKETNDTRREAAFALGSIGKRSSSAVLRRYSTNDDYSLAEICREALLKLSRR